MSKKRKNFHYHYAERYETPEERRARKRLKHHYSVPPMAMLISLAFLVLFGLVSTTFSVYVTNSYNDPDMPVTGGLIVAVKNQTARVDLKSDGLVSSQDTGIMSDAEAEPLPPITVRRAKQIDLATTGVNTYFTENEVLFLYAQDGGSCYSDGAVVKAWFNYNGTDKGVFQTHQVGSTKYNYIVVPVSDANTVQIQRFDSTGNTWWNSNGDIYQSARSNDAYNVIQSVNNGNTGASWKNETYGFELYGSLNSWAEKLGTFVDAKDGNTKFTLTVSDWLAESSNVVKVKDTAGNWFGDNNTSLSLSAGYTYDIVFTVYANNITSTVGYAADQKTWSVDVNAGSNGSVSESGVIVGTQANSLGESVTATPNTGYVFSNWTCTGGASVADATSATTEVYASAAGGTVTANFVEATYCVIDVSEASKTINIGETSSVTVSAFHHASGNITVTSPDATKVLVSSSQNGTYAASATLSGITGSSTIGDTADVWIKPIAKYDGTVTLTAECAVPHESFTSASILVSVNAPAVSFSNIVNKVIAETGTFSPASFTNPSVQRGTISYAIDYGDSVTLSGANNSGFTAMRPGTTGITATYAYSYNGGACSVSASFTVTVDPPSLAVTTVNVEECKTGRLSVNMGSTSPAPSSCVWSTSDTTLISLSNGTASYVDVEAKSISSNTAASVTIAATYSTGYSTTFTATNVVNIYTSNKFFKFNLSTGGNNEEKMRYDSTASSTLNSNVYKATVSLSQGKTYYIDVWDGANDYTYNHTGDSDIIIGTIPLDPDDGGYQFYTSQASWAHLLAGMGGSYDVYYDVTNHKLFITYPDDVYYMLYRVIHDPPNNWVVSETFAFDDDDSDGVFSLSFTVGDDTELKNGHDYQIIISKNGNASPDPNVFTNSSAITADTPVGGYALVNNASGSGIPFTVGAKGEYDLSFNPTAMKLYIDYPADVYYLMGSFNEDDGDWLASDAYIFSDDNDDGIYSLTLNNDPNFALLSSYNLKVSKNGNKTINAFNYTGSTTISESISNYSLTTSGSVASSGIPFDMGAVGTYLFTFDPANSKLSVVYPDREFYLLGFGKGDNYWGTTLASRKMEEDSESPGVFEISFDTEVVSFLNKATSYTQNTDNGFKVYCNDGNFYAPSAATTVSATTVTPLDLNSVAENPNIGFNTTYSGIYTFSFNYSTKKLSVTYPTRSVTKASSGATTDNKYVNFTINSNYTYTFTAVNNSYYNFTSWSISGTAGEDYNIMSSGSLSSNPVTIEFLNEDPITVTATWANKTFTVIFRTNGGGLTGAASNGNSFNTSITNSVYTVQYTYGTGLPSLPTPSIPSGKSYGRGGWYTDPGFSSGKIESLSTTDYGAYTLYYRWTVDVVFKDNITNAQIGDTQTITRQTCATAPTVLISEINHPGFEFIAGNYSGEWNTSVPLDEDTTVYVNFTPLTQPFTVVIDHTTSGHADITVDETGATPHYTIPYGAKLSITASPTIPDAVSGDEYADSILYYWDESASGSYSTSLSSITAVVTGYVYINPDITSLMIKSNGTYTLYAKAKYPNAYGPNDSEGTTEIWSSSNQTYSFTYTVNNPLLSDITPTPDQKIYNTGASIELSAELNPSVYGYNNALNTGDYALKTAFKHYDKTTFSFVQENDSDVENIDISGSGTDTVFTSTFTKLLSNGVSYFRITLLTPQFVVSGGELVDGSVVKENDNVVYIENGNTLDFRAAVGAQSAKASRQLYVAFNSTVLPEDPSRVMLFYNDNGTLAFQTGRSFTLSGNTLYRFAVPSDVRQVSIGVFMNNSYYALPTLSEGSLDYSSSGFYGFSDWTDIKENGSVVMKLYVSSIDSTNHEMTIVGGKLS